MPSSLLHYDVGIHPNPEMFDAERFLASEIGGMGTPVSRATLRPFGGGISYCPGPLFAEKQVAGFLARFLARYDVTVSRTGKIGVKDIPRNADFSTVRSKRM